MRVSSTLSGGLTVAVLAAGVSVVGQRTVVDEAPTAVPHKAAVLTAPRDARLHVSTAVHTVARRPVARAASHRSKPHPVHAVVKRRVQVVRHHAAPPAPAGPTTWPALNAAIARIPTYHAGDATWIVKNTGWWGTTDWGSGVIYISPTVPLDKLYSVAAHEWSHVLSVRDYGGNVPLATSAFDAYFGGTGLQGAEYAADCMAIAQGATWTYYTNCTNPVWRTGARLLVAGRRLPGT